MCSVLYTCTFNYDIVYFENVRFAQRGVEYATNPCAYLHGYRDAFDHMVPDKVSNINIL